MASRFWKPTVLQALSIISLAAWCILAGCGDGNRQISNTEFYGRAPAGVAPLSRNDQPGAIPSRPVDPEEGRSHMEIPSSLAGLATAPVKITPAKAPSDLSDNSAPASQPVTAVGNQYLELGAVVAEVNGKPIFVSDVLKDDALILRQAAREAPNLDAFRRIVEDTYDQQGHLVKEGRVQTDIEVQIQDAQIVAEADNRLTQHDKDVVKFLTENWKINQVNNAGGSLEAARKKVLADTGRTLEDEMEERHRIYLTDIFQEEFIFSRADVTAAEMRAFYESHKSDPLISTPESAEVFIIAVDPKDLGKDLAQSKIEDYRKKVLAGADFATMARDYNTMSIFQNKMTLHPGVLTLEKVDAAIWKLDANQISNIIDDTGKLYLIKVISHEKGIVRPFEDQQIQDAIRNVLIKEKQAVLMQAEERRLDEFGTVTPYDDGKIAAINVVLQNYQKWHEGN